MDKDKCPFCGAWKRHNPELASFITEFECGNWYPLPLGRERPSECFNRQIAQLAEKLEVQKDSWLEIANLKQLLGEVVKAALVKTSIPESSDQWTICTFCGYETDNIMDPEEHTLWCSLKPLLPRIQEAIK